MKKWPSYKIFLLIFFMGTFALFSFSKEKIIPSHWVTSPLTIDGSSEDWANDSLNFEKKVDVDFAFRNDAENLYVIFVFKDPKYLSSINATGMTLWFNLEGKKKKNSGLTFIKKQVSSEVFISFLEQQKGSLSEAEKNDLRANPHYFIHNIKAVGKESESVSLEGESGEANMALFRSTAQEKNVVYEFAVPLKSLTEKSHGIGTEPGKIIKVGFEWGGLTEEMKKARAEGRTIPGTDAMRRGESADSWLTRSSGLSSRSSGGRGPVQYSFWVNVQLAKNQ